MQRQAITLDERVKKATTRAGKIKHIRECFASQPCGGWRRTEVEIYMAALGIKAAPTEKLSDADIDLIYEDLLSSNMILIKRLQEK